MIVPPNNMIYDPVFTESMQVPLDAIGIRNDREHLVEAYQLLHTVPSFLAGKALCKVPISLKHKLAHVLGDTFWWDHSST